ncbi:MAG: NADH-quinone oxidoreductase subunit NuoE [Syntrophaceticus sp.]
MGCSCQDDKTLPDDKKEQIKDVITAYKGQAGSLVAVLQDVQEICGYLPQSVMRWLGKELGIKPAKIYGVATFYTQFRLTPIGKNLIMLCQGTACHVNGTERIEAAVSQELKIESGETTDDGVFTLDTVACLGCCSLAPVMMINGQAYGPLTPDGAVKIIKDIYKQEMESGGEVQ